MKWPVFLQNASGNPIPNAANLVKTNHPKSAHNSEKSSYYQRVLTEELLRTFSCGHHSHQSGSQKFVSREDFQYFCK